MPVVACPKCPTQLKIPDGASGNVKCPKCGTIFPVVASKPATAFEIVDAIPAPKPNQKTALADDSDDFEVVDEKPRKKRARDWEDEDDEDDRPRSKKRRRDEDDEDDSPRKKKKKRRDYDDDYGDGWPQPKPKPAGFGPAKTGALLLGIGAWTYMGTFGLLALLSLIAWAGNERPGGIMVLAGLVGLSNWVLSLVGLGFCIAGPERARGTAIAATVVSAIHLVLLVVCFETRNDVYDQLGIGDSAWAVLATGVTSLNSAVPLLMYHSQAFSGGFLVTLIAGGCEVARLILIVLTLKKLALAARSAAADRAGPAVVAVAGVCGGVALAALLITVLIAESGITRAGIHLAAAVSLLSYVAYAFMTMAPALLAKDTKDALAARV